MSTAGPRRSAGVANAPGLRIPGKCRTAARRRLTLEVLEGREAPSVGGGFTGGGIVGEYFDNTTLSGAPAFTRTDVRINFDWGTTMTPGGSISAPFNSIGNSNFSVLWTGDVVPAFSETYTFSTLSAAGVQLFIRPTGTTAWTTLIDDWTAHTATTDTGAFTMTGGSTYDIMMEYYQTTGPAVAELGWSSPSVPYEIIDVLNQNGINNPDLTSGFANIVQGARNSWLGPRGGGAAPGTDANGWPTGDGGYVFQESLNQGLGLDPLMQGTISFSFNGSANVSLYGNVNLSSLTYSYDAADNTTTGSFVTANDNINASIFFFSNSHRNGTTGPGGITNLELMRPTSPGASTSYNPDVIFDSQILAAMSQFTIMRFQLVANQQVNWSDRTLPSYFNQANGNITAPYYGNGSPSDDGPSWEYEVMLANETGRDLMLSIPPAASGESPTDTTSYIYNLANLLKYGSNQAGVPYTSYQANPYYPGLEPNLRVYLELGNELWNYAGVFATDFANINSITAANAAADNADFQIINFDNLSTAQSNGNYVSMNTWRYREIMLRLYQISNIFESVWGSSEILTNIRPLYEWQYDNQNDTASIALTFADDYFDNGDGIEHVTDPEPVNDWLWGGGGASYYTASNSEGLTTLLPDNEFATPVLSGPGFVQDPSGSPWTFAGTAGIAQAGTGDIPPAFSGNQMGYITDNGSMSVTFTAPTTQTSSIYGVSFTALNAIPTGSSTADTENIRLYLDGTDITADTVDQTNGYTPAGYNASEPWDANNVYWTTSQYYYTVSFNLAPGSTHTITIKGTNAAGSNQTVFLGDVQVTSVDAIFASSIPGGGQSTSQPSLTNIQATMDVEADWALAYGLQPLGYESGWALGGDDGGSWVQTEAKFGDPRTAAVQEQFMQYFAQSGSAVDVFGTYPQWPSWSDYYAQQGLLNVSEYPIMQGIEEQESVLPAAPTNGVLAPAILKPPTAVIANNANQSNGRVSSAGGFLDWNIIVPQTGTYAIALTTTGTGANVEMLVDGQDLAAGGSGGNLTGDILLTKGIHSLKVQDLSATAFNVSQITVVEPGAPAAPTVTSAVDQNAAVALSWAAVAGASGYGVAYGTSSGAYGQTINVGTALNYTVTGLTNDQTYYFAVYAYNSAGMTSLPSAESVVTPFANGEVANLASWNLAGDPGNEASVPVTSVSARAEASAIVRGPYLTPQTWPYSGVGALASYAAVQAQSLASAESLGEYYQFSAGPAAGYAVSLSQVQFLLFAQNQSNVLNFIALAWSTDGVNFTIGPALSMVNNYVTANLSGIAALQNTTATVFFRVYTFGQTNYFANGFYSEDGNDVVVSGAVQPTTTTTLTETSGSTSNATQPLNFNVQVSGGSPTGLVQIEDTSNNNAVVASGTLTAGEDGAMTLTIPAETMFAGTHNLIAVYAGDSNYAASTSTNSVTQTVQLAITSVTVNGNPGNTTITSATENASGLVTIIMAAADGFTNNEAVKITVTGQSGYNGVFDVTPLNGTNGTEFTYQDNNAANLPSASAGSAVYALSGAQRSMVTNIVYVFSEPVNNLTASDFTLGLQAGVSVSGGAGQMVGNTTGVSLSVSNPSGDGMTWVVAFSGAGVTGGSLTNGVYTISANTGSITSLANATQTAQARATDTFARLFGSVAGDVTSNNNTTVTVKAANANACQAEIGLLAGEPNYQAYFDASGGGARSINASDLQKVETDVGETYTSFLATI
jgi:hypothetical protein